MDVVFKKRRRVSFDNKRGRMIYLGLLLFLLYSFVAGTREGVIMYQPTNRVHPWFVWYHLLRPVEVLELILGTIFLWTVREQVWNVFLILGLLVLSWELFEISYRWARLHQCDGHENIMGIYVVDGEAPVRMLHIARFFCGIGSLILWRYL